MRGARLLLFCCLFAIFKAAEVARRSKGRGRMQTGTDVVTVTKPVSTVPTTTFNEPYTNVTIRKDSSVRLVTGKKSSEAGITGPPSTEEQKTATVVTGQTIVDKAPENLDEEERVERESVTGQEELNIDDMLVTRHKHKPNTKKVKKNKKSKLSAIAKARKRAQEALKRAKERARKQALLAKKKSKEKARKSAAARKKAREEARKIAEAKKRARERAKRIALAKKKAAEQARKIAAAKKRARARARKIAAAKKAARERARKIAEEKKNKEEEKKNKEEEKDLKEKYCRCREVIAPKTRCYYLLDDKKMTCDWRDCDSKYECVTGEESEGTMLCMLRHAEVQILEEVKNEGYCTRKEIDVDYYAPYYTGAGLTS